MSKGEGRERGREGGRERDERSERGVLHIIINGELLSVLKRLVNCRDI